MAAEVVYVIGQRGTALVKIGRTTNLQRRLATIQTACPNRIEILWHTEGGSALERGLHAEFRHLRTHGEWFDFGALDPVTTVRGAATRPLTTPRPQGPTPLRNFRAPDGEWAAFRATSENNMTSLIRQFIRWYLRRPGAELPQRPTREQLAQSREAVGSDESADA